VSDRMTDVSSMNEAPWGGGRTDEASNWAGYVQKETNDGPAPLYT
jgi:hypothetical protein